MSNQQQLADCASVINRTRTLLRTCDEDVVFGHGISLSVQPLNRALVSAHKLASRILASTSSYFEEMKLSTLANVPVNADGTLDFSVTKEVFSTYKMSLMRLEAIYEQVDLGESPFDDSTLKSFDSQVDCMIKAFESAIEFLETALSGSPSER